MAIIQSLEAGRKEDGNRSIADKIVKRLHDLEKTLENNLGRWAWELLQNAKDSVTDEDEAFVSVQIELDENKVVFRHNGIHFTEWDVRGLINQITSKEAEDGVPKRKTGKFGTGFLTTHLLSKVITVSGILKAQDGIFYSFSFPLDRSEKKINLLAEKIEETWRGFHASTKRINQTYDRNAYNTSFSYPLATPQQKEIARKGIDEFLNLVPLALAFNPRIASVEVLDNTQKLATLFEVLKEPEGDNILEVIKTENGSETTIPILISSNERLSIASLLKRTKNGHQVMDIDHLPKLFCDFPLIGTEEFHFPVIVNSFYFNPQTERDGIWLKGSSDPEVVENQQLLQQAVGLYRGLLKTVEGKNFFNLYNLADTRDPGVSEKYFDSQWYRSCIQLPLRELLFDTPMVELENSEAKTEPSKIWLALRSYSKTTRQKIWQYTYDLYPSHVCKREHLENWCQLSWDAWNKQDYNELTNDIAKSGNLQTLAETLTLSESKAINWLNEVCKFLQEDDANLSFFEKKELIPNRYGTFCTRTNVWINKIHDDDLIHILELLGEDWKNLLIHPSINFGRYFVKEKKDIATVITEKINKAQKKDENFNQAIIRLSQWLEDNAKEGKDLFAEIYRKRAEIFMNTIEDKESLYTVMRSTISLKKVAEVTKAIEEDPSLLDSISRVAEVNDLMKAYAIKSVNQLQQALLVAKEQQANNQRTEITEETLIQLGVGSIRELEEALKDKNISARFTHESTPRVEMFLIVQQLITRSKANVIAHLQEDDQYDTSEWEEIAPTIIGGIRKLNQPIYIVVRPADKREVIIYYSSERDTLEQPNAELWIDDGINSPSHLTLGKILKSTGINRIPL